MLLSKARRSYTPLLSYIFARFLLVLTPIFLMVFVFEFLDTRRTVQRAGRFAISPY